MVYGYGGLARLTVADYEFPLAAAYGNHRVDGFKSRLQRLIYGLTEDYAGSFALQRHRATLAAYLAESVYGLSKRVDYPPEHFFAHVYRGDAPRPLDRKAFFDFVGWAEQHGSHVILFEVHHNAHHAAFELD